MYVWVGEREASRTPVKARKCFPSIVASTGENSLWAFHYEAGALNPFFIADPISFIALGTTFYCKSALLYCESLDDITRIVENDFWESPYVGLGVHFGISPSKVLVLYVTLLFIMKAVSLIRDAQQIKLLLVTDTLSNINLNVKLGKIIGNSFTSWMKLLDSLVDGIEQDLTVKCYSCDDCTV